MKDIVQVNDPLPLKEEWQYPEKIFESSLVTFHFRETGSYQVTNLF